MKTPRVIKLKLYPNLKPYDFAGNSKDEKSISEWLRLRGFDLLKIRFMNIYHLDFRCPWWFFDEGIRNLNLPKKI